MHGFLESSSMWKDLPLETLKIQSILIDLPGHGSSPLSDEFSKNRSVGQMADEVIELIDHLGIKEFNIVGHSMGGYVALEVKNKRPLCQKVVLLNSNYWEDAVPKKRDRKRIAKLAFESKNYFIRKAIPSLFIDPKKYQKEVTLLLDEAFQIKAEAIAFSSLAMAARKNWKNLNPKGDYYLIHGANDRLLSRGQIDHHIINSENVFIIKDGGHMCHIESPKEVFKVLNEILFT
ncbi:MAG: alpha/beta hydrolase [Crocinitomicaceae bacterium]